MPTKTLGSGNDTVTIAIDIGAKINQQAPISGKGILFDGGAGTDTIYIQSLNYTASFGYFSLTANAAGVVTLTTSSGSARFQNFESIKFSNLAINLGTSGNDFVTGGGRADKFLYGLAGNDTLNGGGGADTMYGGVGNDTYVVDNTLDIVIEAANEGVDTIQSTVTQALTTNVENLALTGTVAINGTGNGLNNILTGNSAANTLTGGGGNDTIAGGGGADTVVFSGARADYLVTAISASQIELVDGVGGRDGTDRLSGVTNVQFSDRTVTFASLLATSAPFNGTSGADILNGTSINDVINGLAGNDILNGNAGFDILAGGADDDIYVVDTTTDIIVEQFNDGTDTLQSSVTQSGLAANIENLTLTGIAAINGTGNSLNNTLTGNSAANTLSGGAGVDILIGGSGNDLYIVDTATDTIIELPDAGTDTVQSSVTQTSLANEVENLTLVGAAAINGTGNGQNNIIIANAAANTIDGGAGNDSLSGGAGNDIYLVDSSLDVVTEKLNEGTDTIRSSVGVSALAANVENLSLTGSADINGNGNALANVIIGNAGSNALDGGDGNDTLNGSGGADTLSGGLGDDLFVVDSVDDTVTELFNQGTDTVQSSVTIAELFANIEKLILLGASAIDGTGNSLSNTITGNGAANVLDGGAGNDALIGGAGNDVYVFDSVSDVATETVGGGSDTVQSSVTINALGINIEDLQLSGNSAINGTGNALGNAISGNGSANTLNGRAGNDVIQGNGGNDTIDGGGGFDTFIVSGAKANYAITFLNATQVQISDSVGGRDGIDILTNIVEIRFSDVTVTVSNLLSAGGLPNLINGTIGDDSLVGTAGNDALNGLAGNDTLNGGDGFDTLAGGAGDDIYVVDTAMDTLTELANDGKDTLQSSVTIGFLASNIENITLTGVNAINATGNDLANAITGNSANNIFSGGRGNDTFEGAGGTDTVVLTGVKSDYSIAVLSANSIAVTDLTAGRDGTDTISNVTNVQFSDGLETVAALIVAHAGDATILGTAGDDADLRGTAGNDRIDGGFGNDKMTGGAGNDTYLIDSALDNVVEEAIGGFDTIVSTVSVSLLASNVENLTLSGNRSIDGTGNSLNNFMVGNAFANKLDGRLGSDRMYGGGGNDTYYLNLATDVVSENAGEGTDTVRSQIDYKLGAYVENLMLLKGATKGAGNALNNHVTGNGAANIIIGGGGHDVLTGGNGKDIFDFNRVKDIGRFAGARDRITDFKHSFDKIDLATMDADTQRSGNSAFSFIGSRGFSGDAGELHFQYRGSKTIVSGDVNGDKVADFQLQLDGHKTLFASDFIL